MHGVDFRTTGNVLRLRNWLFLSGNPMVVPNISSSRSQFYACYCGFAPANLKKQSFSSRSLLCKHSFTIGQADSFLSGLIQHWFSLSEEDSYYVCSQCLLGQGHQMMSAFIHMIFFPCTTHPCGRQLKDGAIDCEMHVHKNWTCCQNNLRIIQSIKHLAYT